MANKAIFKSADSAPLLPAADASNSHGKPAYNTGAEHLLAQVACTGTFNQTAYQSPEDQLKAIHEAADQCSPTFIAQVASGATGARCGWR